MENQAFWGIVFGSLGAFIGLAGGAFGTYCAIKNTNGPAERAFAVKLSVFLWTYLLVVFAALYFVFPDSLKYGALFLLPILLLIPSFNKMQHKIVQSEQTPNKTEKQNRVVKEHT